MKKRFFNWVQHLIWKYTEPTTKIANLEAKRYSKYITEHYSELEQIMILKNLHSELISYREEQIKNKEILILQEKENMSKLDHNLNKLLVYREP